MSKEFLNIIAASLLTVINVLFGGWDKILVILAILLTLDYATGLVNAYINKELNSKTSFRGLIKKASIFIVIILAHQVDLATNSDTPIFRTMSVYFYIANEGISLLENLTAMGVPFPAFLTDVLNNIQNKNNKMEG